MSEVAAKWLEATKENETITLADTNINLTNLNKQPTELDPHDRKQIPVSRILRNMVLNNGVAIIPTRNTRYNHQTKLEEWLDHCYTTHPEKLQSQTIHVTGDSDHYIGQFVFNTTTKTSQPRYIINRNWKEINWDLLRLNLHNDSDLDQVNSMEDPDEICQIIQSTITYHPDNAAPLRKIQIKSKYPAFTTQETRELIDKRDRTYKDARQTDDADTWRFYKNLRNRVHVSLRKDKKEYISKELDENKNEREKWDAVKNLIGWRKKKNTPTLIAHVGTVTTSPKGIAKVLNHHLLSKVATTVRNIPKTSTDPLKNYEKLMNDKNCNFKIQEVKEQEVKNIILKMKSSHSAGCDNIPSRVLKECLNSLYKPITKLINTSIKSSQYPKN